MSLFFTYFNNNEAYVAADSRCSTEVKGKHYIVGDAQKYAIINNMIITYGGAESFCLVVLEAFRQFPVELQNIDNLARTARMIWHNKDEYIKLWRIRNLDNSECEAICDFAVTYYDKDENVIKHILIGCDNDYSPIVRRGEPRYKISVRGFGQEKACEYLVSTADNITVEEWFLGAYKAVSSECVGGTMTLIHMVEGNIISEETAPIVDVGEFGKLVIEYGTKRRELWLGADRENILTYIGKDGVVDTQLAKKDTNAIQGKHISCAGLNISGSGGSFSVDENGCVTMDNSTQTMTNGKNQIKIDPGTGILFTNDGDTVVKFNITDGSAEFSGTISASKIIADTSIDVNTVATIGEKLVLQDRDTNTTGYDEAADISVDTGTMYISTKNGRSISLSTGGTNGGNISLNAGTTGGAQISLKADSIGDKPKVYANNKRVLVTDDLDDLDNTFKDIQTDIASLWNAINALSNSNNPGIII